MDTYYTIISMEEENHIEGEEGKSIFCEAEENGEKIKVVSYKESEISKLLKW